jgi:hypothetical protein
LETWIGGHLRFLQDALIGVDAHLRLLALGDEQQLRAPVTGTVSHATTASNASTSRMRLIARF